MFASYDALASPRVRKEPTKEDPLKNYLAYLAALIWLIGLPPTAPTAHAQSSNPSAKANLQLLSIDTIENDIVKSRPDEVIEVITSALAQTQFSPLRRGELLVWRARAFLVKQDIISSDSDITLAMEVLGDRGSNTIMCYALTTDGDRHRRAGEFDVSLKTYAKAYDTCVLAGDAKMSFATHIAKGSIYGLTEDATAAREHFSAILANKGVRGAPSLEWTEEMHFDVLYAYGVALGNAKNERDALQVFQEALKLARAMDDGGPTWAGNTSFAAQSLGQAMASQGRYKEALEAIDAADVTNERMNDLIGLALADGARADIHLKKGDLDAALVAAKAALAHLVDTKGSARQFELDLLDTLAKVQLAQRDFEAAAGTMGQAKALTEKIFSERRASEVAKLQEQLQASRRKAENASLQVDLSKQRLLAEQRHRQLVAGSIALVMSILAACTIATLLLRSRRLSQDLAKTVAQREALVREVNHRVKNNLQVILSFLQLKGRKLQSDGVSRLERNILRDIENRIKSIALIHKQLNTDDPTGKVNMAAFLTELGGEFQQLYKGVAKIEFGSAPFALPLDRAVPLGLIVSELVSNAAEHAFPTPSVDDIIKVQIQCLTGQKLQLTVSDNGIGFPAATLDDTQSTTIGLALVWSLADQIDATLAQTQGVAGGTTWTVDFQSEEPALP
jgi:two-component sensor histidine kinase